MAKKVRKVHVTVKPMRLDGLRSAISGEEKKLFAMVELKWKGPVSGFGFGLVPFYRTSSLLVNQTESKPADLGVNHVEWDEEFERMCCLVGPWNLSFYVFYSMEGKPKKIKIGKASIDLWELASKFESTEVRKLLIRSKGSVLPKETILVVNVTFSDVKTEPFVDSVQQINPGIPSKITNAVSREISLQSRRSNSDQLDSFSSSVTVSSSGGRSPLSPENQSEPIHRTGFNWWKRRRLSFSISRKREPRDEECAKMPSKQLETEGKKALVESPLIEANQWIVKDLVSRDGKSKLRSEVYLASLDQRSEQAAGGAACAAVAVVVAHWFHANPTLINPPGKDFDSLITQGSALWQSLCDNESYLTLFPDKHFDLETVVSANLRPVRVCTDKSFTGVFSPERFGSLEGLMSFEEIWDEVEKEVAIASDRGESRVYIVSWNDHFFVVKADGNGYCIIDSLGERLFEGCKQAYILKFDDSSLIYETKVEEKVKPSSNSKTGEDESSETLVYKGKQCCREYIKRFLAAILVAHLAVEEKKGNAVGLSLLHEKLQIDLNHIALTTD